jgi:hypothetical protein
MQDNDLVIAIASLYLGSHQEKRQSTRCKPRNDFHLLIHNDTKDLPFVSSCRTLQITDIHVSVFYS